MDDEYFPNEYDEEEVFDQMIYPLMQTIVNICNEYNIPMISSFQFSNDGSNTKLCTSVVAPPNRVDSRITEAAILLTDPD